MTKLQPAASASQQTGASASVTTAAAQSSPLLGMNYLSGLNFVSPHMGALGIKPGPVASAAPDGTVTVRGRVIGRFVGEFQGRTRAEIIAERLSGVAASLGTAAATREESGKWKVTLSGADFEVRQEDAQASGYLCRRLAAHHVASALSGKALPPDVDEGNKDGTLSKAESDAVIAYRSEPVTVEGDGSIVAHGVRLGPFVGNFDGRSRAEIIAERLREVPSSSYRGATSNGSTVLVGGQTFTVTDGDAAAQGEKSARAGATAQAALLDGTWARGAQAEAGRRVLPATMSTAALFEVVRAIAEGPGHTTVDMTPGQVTVVGLRGVRSSGVYDPALGAEDDLIVPLVVDRQDRRHALRLSGTVDPGGTSDGATQVGDATSEFYYSNQSGNSALAGTPLLRPDNKTGIAGKDVSKLRSYEQVGGKARGQTATLIHFGTHANQSRGCTVIVDRGSYNENKADLTTLYDKGVQALGSDVLDLDSAGVSVQLGKERANTPPDKKRIERLESLLQLRLLEEAKSARDRGDTETERARSATLAGDEVPAEGKTYDYEALTKAANYKAFLSLIHRDPEMRVRYVIVDGSKIASFQGPAA